MTGRMIEYNANGALAPGYLATPDVAENTTPPGVVVLHAWWGLTEPFRQVCDRLAAAGYVALAPDLYRGQTTASVEEAEALASALDQESERVRGDIVGAVRFLRQHGATVSGDGGGALALVGFSLGAAYALDMSVSLPEEIAAVVIFYGTYTGPDFHRARAAYLCHFAENDPFEPAEAVAEMERTLLAAGRPATCYTYPGTTHWFFEANRPDAYDAAAAALAWGRTIAFLNAELRRPAGRSTSKAQLLDELRDEQAQWEALLRDIGEDHMIQPGVAGEWSIKDIIAHLTGWRRRTVGRFQAALRHEPAPPPAWLPHLQTDDEINAWIYAAYRDRPLADVLRDSREVFEQLVEALDAFPEADLLDPARFPWLEADDLPLTGAAFFGHFHEEHEPDMRAWLERIRQEAG
jgi:carboxymethylenebutenolidase